MADCSEKSNLEPCELPKTLGFNDNQIVITQNGYTLFSLCLGNSIEITSYSLSEKIIKPGEEKYIFSCENYKGVFVKSDASFWWKTSQYKQNTEGSLEPVYLSNTDWIPANPYMFMLEESGSLTDMKVKNPNTKDIKLNILLVE